MHSPHMHSSPHKRGRDEEELNNRSQRARPFPPSAGDDALPTPDNAIYSNSPGSSDSPGSFDSRATIIVPDSSSNDHGMSPDLPQELQSPEDYAVNYMLANLHELPQLVIYYLLCIYRLHKGDEWQNSPFSLNIKEVLEYIVTILIQTRKFTCQICNQKKEGLGVTCKSHLPCNKESCLGCWKKWMIQQDKHTCPFCRTVGKEYKPFMSLPSIKNLIRSRYITEYSFREQMTRFKMSYSYCNSILQLIAAHISKQDLSEVSYEWICSSSHMFKDNIEKKQNVLNNIHQLAGKISLGEGYEPLSFQEVFDMLDKLPQEEGNAWREEYRQDEKAMWCAILICASEKSATSTEAVTLISQFKHVLCTASQTRSYNLYVIAHKNVCDYVNTSMDN